MNYVFNKTRSFAALMMTGILFRGLSLMVVYFFDIVLFIKDKILLHSDDK